MLSVETVIVAAGLVNAALVVGGTALTLYPLTRIRDPRRVTWRARYRRGRHHHPSLWARLLDAYLTSVRDLAEARALLTGDPDVA